VIRTVRATRYVTPLREGGSLPAIVEADDDGLYVVKFRGAGQGKRALIAELIIGEIGRWLGLPVPEIVFVELDPALGRNEPDPEIKALLDASTGLNVGLDFLPGAIAYDPAASTGPPPDPGLASAVVWFDAYVTNVDRTPRNTNLLLWHRRLWLIDHGAGLYFHHAWRDPAAAARAPFPRIKEHVLLSLASALPEADAELAPRLTGAALESIVALVPEGWLGDVPGFADVAAHRRAYVEFLTRRLEAPRAFTQEAVDARAGRV
jgi:hypothetical protein